MNRHRHRPDALVVGIKKPLSVRSGGPMRPAAKLLVFVRRYGLEQQVSNLLGRIFADVDDGLVSHDWPFVKAGGLDRNHRFGGISGLLNG